MKIIIHTERSFVNNQEWEDYLDHCRINGVFYPTVLKALRLGKNAELRSPTENVVTTYTIEQD